MTLRVLVGQLERYAELPRSVAELHELFCAGLDQDMDPEGRFRLVNGEPTVNFGKNRGRHAEGHEPRGARLPPVDPEGRLLGAGQGDRAEVPARGRTSEQASPQSTFEARVLSQRSRLSFELRTSSLLRSASFPTLLEPQRLAAVDVADAHAARLELDASTCRPRRASPARTP